MEAAHEALIEAEKKHENQLKKLESALDKMEDKLLKPFQQYKLELQSITALQEKMPQYADVWAEELDKIQAKNPGMLLLEATIKRHITAYDEAAKAAAAWRRASGDDLADRPGFLSESSFTGNDDPLAQKGGGGRMRNDALRDAQAAQAGFDAGLPTLDKLSDTNEKLRASYAALTDGAAQKFTDEMVKYSQDLESGVIPNQDEYNLLVKKLHDQYNDMKTPQEAFALGLKDAQDKLGAQIYTLDAFNKKLHEPPREPPAPARPATACTTRSRRCGSSRPTTRSRSNVFNASISELQKGFDSLVSGKGSVEDWGRVGGVDVREDHRADAVDAGRDGCALGALGFNVPGLGGGAATVRRASSDYNGPVDYSGGVSNGVGADGGGAAYDAAPWPSPGGGAGGSSTATPMQHVTHNHYFIYNDNGDKRALSSSSGMSHPNMQSLLDHVRGRQ